MKKISKVLAVTVAMTLCTSMATPVHASENAFADTFLSGVYGGMAGALVGGALMAFTSHPSDHYNYLSVGAAVGVLGGVGFGVAKATRSFAEVENGKVKFGMPTVVPVLTANTATGQTSVVYSTKLVSGTF